MLYSEYKTMGTSIWQTVAGFSTPGS